MTKIERFGNNAKEKLLKATTRGVYLALSEIQSTAVDLAPIRQGTLRESATINRPTVQGSRVVGDVSFPIVYAAVQHESEHFNHPRGGQAKYLQTAAERHKSRVAAHINREVNR